MWKMKLNEPGWQKLGKKKKKRTRSKHRRKELRMVEEGKGREGRTKRQWRKKWRRQKAL